MTRGLLIAALGLALLAGGCVAPAFYSDIQGNNYAHPGAVTTSGGKVATGTACWTSYVGIVAIGDASVAAALQNAGVDTTKPVKNMVVDHKVFAIGPFYTEYCTVVTVTTQGGASGGAAAAAPSAPAGGGDESGDKSGEDDSFDWQSD